MKNINWIKVYGVIGKALCGIAGAIIGFILGGVYQDFLSEFFADIC